MFGNRETRIVVIETVKTSFVALVHLLFCGFLDLNVTCALFYGLFGK